VLVRGQEVSLSPKGWELFLTYPRRVWSREQLLDQVWGMDFVGDSKTVDTSVGYGKIRARPQSSEYIVTVRGFGYRFG